MIRHRINPAPWLALIAGAAASVSVPALAAPLSSTAPGSERLFVPRSDSDAEKTEVIEVDIVLCVLAGVDCTEEEATAFAAAAIRRANEILKDACVRLNLKSVEVGYSDAGNTDENGSVDENSEAEDLRDGTIGAVQGEDDEGNDKKGLKVVAVKEIIGYERNADGEKTGETFMAEGIAPNDPWTAVKKNTDDGAEDRFGETLAHEIGHAFGDLDDLEDMEDMNNLMYWVEKEDSPLELNKAQAAAIREGARAHGRVVKTDPDPDAADDSPKVPERKATGSAADPVGDGAANPAGDIRSGLVSLPSPNEGSFFDPDRPPYAGGLSISRNLITFVPQINYHLGLNTDGDVGTGFADPQWQGADAIVTVRYMTDTGTTSGELQVFETGEIIPIEASATPGGRYLDSFNPDLPTPGFFVPLPELVELEFSFPSEILPIPPLPPGVPITGRGVLTPSPSPFDPLLPTDDLVNLVIPVDDFDGRPLLTAPGSVPEGTDEIEVSGSGFDPTRPVIIRVDGEESATTMPAPDGTINVMLPVPPPVLNEGPDFVIIDGKQGETGESGYTWVRFRPLPCPADFDGNGFVDAGDLAFLIGAWGQFGSGADLDGDGQVGASDLAILIGAWGPCPVATP